MSGTDETKLKSICVDTIVALHANPALMAKFRAVASGDSHNTPEGQKQFVALLTSAPISVPEDVAANLAKKSDDELYEYVGKYVCQYFW